MNQRSIPTSFCGLLLLSAVLATTGCGPTSTAQQLLGEWRGRPDTFAAQRERNPIPSAPGYKPPPPAADAKTVSQTEAAQKLQALQPNEQTDLEAFDFVVSLDFRSDGAVVMKLDGGQQKTGVWKVLSTDVGVSIVELTDTVPPKESPQTPQGSDKPPAPPGELTKRRYALKMSDDGDSFTLREEGVDPRFGWLLFKRAE